MSLLSAFILGAIAWWATNVLLRNIAHGGTKIGSDARQKWLSQMSYDTLLRTKHQIDQELARRQPGTVPDPPTIRKTPTDGT